MVAFIAHNPPLRSVVSSLEECVVPLNRYGRRIAHLHEKAEITHYRNEEQVAAVLSAITERVLHITTLVRQLLKENEQHQLATLMRHAGGEPLLPSSLNAHVQHVVREHTYGPKILSMMETEIATYGIRVHREIEPLLIMPEEIRGGRDLLSTPDQITKLTSLPGT